MIVKIHTENRSIPADKNTIFAPKNKRLFVYYDRTIVRIKHPLDIHQKRKNNTTDRFGRMILYEKDTISSLQMSYDNTIMSTIIAFKSVL